MALRTPLTAQPHLYIGDSTGRPLDYGRVYFGEPNKDPEFYPIDIYLDPEMTIAAAQPVRTKGGFMDVGGNLAELHAAEVVYSLKVLDQYGRQVFYKPEMYRNNVSDFLVDEITRATAAETLIAGNLTAETQRAVAAEKVIADAVVAEKDRAVAAEDALDSKYATLDNTVAGIVNGRPTTAFATKALMTASALVDGDYAMVTDDTVNNGLYVKTAGAWVKSPYSPVMSEQLSEYQKTLGAIADRGSLNALNLNDLLESGFYVQNSPANATPENNYPAARLGILTVYKSKSTSLCIQEYKTNLGQVFVRMFAGSWGAWGSMLDAERLAPALIDYSLKSESPTFKGTLTSSDDINNFNTMGFWSAKTIFTNWESMHLPASVPGVLQVIKERGSSQVYQLFITDGGIYTRYFNGAAWSFWSIGSSTGGGTSSNITYSKTANELIFYIPSASGKNSVRYTFTRYTDPVENADSWGIRSCDEVDESKAFVKKITATGVWGCALKAVENINDHSGGAHGDEVLDNAYFEIDGIYYTQDFVGSGVASEIRFWQKSKIFIEASTSVLCDRQLMWSFKKNGLDMRQNLVFPTAKGLTNSWVAMLPVLRKANPDNTGAIVTDTEVRSQDGIAIDVSEPLFAVRSMALSAGDSITLSSSVSGISAALIVNKLDVSANNFAYVNNSATYNKIYVSGTGAGVYTTSEGETWDIDVTFNVKTRN